MLLTLIQKEAFLRYALRSSVEHFNHDLRTASKILILMGNTFVLFLHFIVSIVIIS